MVGNHPDAAVGLKQVVAAADDSVVAALLLALEVVRVRVVHVVLVGVVRFLREGKRSG